MSPEAKRGFEKATFRLRPDQVAELHKEARRRAEERNSLRPDGSEIVREALDAWFGDRARRRGKGG